MRDMYSESLVSKEERDKQIREIMSENPELSEDDIDPWSYDLPVSLDAWCGNEYLEYGHDTFTTKSGELIHAVYKYGYDG